MVWSTTVFLTPEASTLMSIVLLRRGSSVPPGAPNLTHHMHCIDDRDYKKVYWLTKWNPLEPNGPSDWLLCSTWWRCTWLSNHKHTSGDIHISFFTTQLACLTLFFRCLFVCPSVAICSIARGLQFTRCVWARPFQILEGEGKPCQLLARDRLVRGTHILAVWSVGVPTENSD